MGIVLKGLSPMDALEFRRLASKDKELVASLFRKCFPAYSLEDMKLSWKYRSHKDSFGFWQGDNFVGFAIGSYHSRSGSSLYIDYFALDDTIRGKGVGTEIIKTFLENFEGSVHLYPISEAIARWYGRNGFRKSNKGYYVFHTYGTRSRGPSSTK